MGPNFVLWVSIHPNPGNIFMAVFIDLWPCLFTLNSAKLSCSSEVTLLSVHIAHRRLFDFIGILFRLTFFGYFDPPWVGAVLFSHTCQVSPKDYIKATLKAEGRYYSFLGSQEIPVCRHNWGRLGLCSKAWLFHVGPFWQDSVLF